MIGEGMGGGGVGSKSKHWHLKIGTRKSESTASISTAGGRRPRQSAGAPVARPTIAGRQRCLLSSQPAARRRRVSVLLALSAASSWFGVRPMLCRSSVLPCWHRAKFYLDAHIALRPPVCCCQMSDNDSDAKMDRKQQQMCLSLGVVSCTRSAAQIIHDWHVFWPHVTW